MVALVPPLKLRHAMMAHVQFGLTGPAGTIAVRIVMVELSQGAAIVKTARKVIAREQP